MVYGKTESKQWMKETNGSTRRDDWMEHKEWDAMYKEMIAEMFLRCHAVFKVPTHSNVIYK